MNIVTRAHWAQAKANSDFIWVTSRSGYRGGDFFDPAASEHYLALACTDEALGLAVRDALQHSRWVLFGPREGITIPPEVEFDAVFCNPTIRAAGYAEWIREVCEKYGYKTKRALSAMENSFFLKPCHSGRGTDEAAAYSSVVLASSDLSLSPIDASMQYFE